MTRRQLLAASLTATGGLAGATALAKHNGLLPPDAAGPFGPGETLNYLTHRLLTGDAPAREFARSEISAKPFANGTPPADPVFLQHQANGFADWRLQVEGMVQRPSHLAVADLRRFAPHTQITQLTCEEGWGYVAEWTGARVADLLDHVGASPAARFVVYFSHQQSRWDSVDLPEARHPQTLLAYGFNGGDLPVGHGGPMRFRVPRQLGYKSIKFVNRLLITDSLAQIGKGLGAAAPEHGYAWFAGI